MKRNFLLFVGGGILVHYMAPTASLAQQCLPTRDLCQVIEPNAKGPPNILQQSCVLHGPAYCNLSSLLEYSEKNANDLMCRRATTCNPAPATAAYGTGFPLCDSPKHIQTLMAADPTIVAGPIVNPTNVVGKDQDMILPQLASYPPRGTHIVTSRCFERAEGSKTDENCVAEQQDPLWAVCYTYGYSTFNEYFGEWHFENHGNAPRYPFVQLYWSSGK